MTNDQARMTNQTKRFGHSDFGFGHSFGDSGFGILFAVAQGDVETRYVQTACQTGTFRGMSEQSPKLIKRIGSWFRRPKANGQAATSDLVRSDARPSLFNPSAKRDQAIANLQQGFNTLTDLMTTIKDNLNDQGRRQDELLTYLSHLPKAIEGIPETNRLQVESLKAISLRLEHQNTQQNLIGEILGKLADADHQQKQAMEDVAARVENVAEQNKTISENLSNVGSAMQTVSKNSAASADVLEQVRDNIEKRDGQLERLLHKQATRFTSLLYVAIFLSIAALVAVVILMVQMMNKPAAGSAPTTQTTDLRGAM
jgi:methyl-accepting chemotaxis protein